MNNIKFRLIDNNTGEEISPSNDFDFYAVPTPEHRIHDPEILARYGGPAVIDRVEEVKTANGQPMFDVYIDGVEEQVNADTENDENYRRS
jgi:hypothetical protein